MAGALLPLGVGRELVGYPLAADVDGGAAFRVRFRLPQDLAGNGGGVSLAEEDVADQVDDRVALRPAEVAVWSLAGGVAQVQEEGAVALGTVELLARSTL